MPNLGQLACEENLPFSKDLKSLFEFKSIDRFCQLITDCQRCVFNVQFATRHYLKPLEGGGMGWGGGVFLYPPEGVGDGLAL